MTQPKRISWLAVCAALAALAFTPGNSAAQNFVTPTVAPTPGIGVTGQFAGQFIIVNSAPGAEHVDPHVSGDLVCYTNVVTGAETVHYFNLPAGPDTQVPNPNSAENQDLLCDANGSVVTFTRVSPGESGILTLDTSVASAQPVEDPPSELQVYRQASRIGSQTIVYQQLNPSGLGWDIFAYDRGTGIVQQIDPPAIAGLENVNPGTSTDGSVAIWLLCESRALDSPCAIWLATLANGAWTAQQLQSLVAGMLSPPDIDGNFVTYGSNLAVSGSSVARVVWQPANGGTEQVLDLPGSSVSPSISSGFITFVLEAPGASYHDLMVYDVANNILYNVTADLAKAGLIPAPYDAELPDISITPDAKARLVWQDTPSGDAIYAFTFYVGSNLVIRKTAPPTAPAGSNIPYTITVTNNGPQDATSVAVTDSLPAGMTFVSCAPSTGTCTEVTSSGTFTVTINFGSLAAGTSATATLVLSAPSSMSSGAVLSNTAAVSAAGLNTNPNNNATATVTLTISTTSIANTIGQLLGAGCIDNSGIANALTSKLAAAQAFLSAGDNLDAINALSALLNQVRAQAGKHIASSCTINGQTFNSATLLITDVQSLIDSLRVGMIADPITGYVANSANVGVPGAVVSLSDRNGNTLAAATTDITGFYYFATTGVLSSGFNYAIAVTGLPSGFATSTPSQPFTWQGTGLAFDFALN